MQRTFVLSLLLSRNACSSYMKWLGTLGFGFMYMMADYVTYKLANNIAAGRMNVPDAAAFAAGTVLSLIGMGAGHVIYRLKRDN